MSQPISPLILAAERIATHNVALRSFLLRLLDPDDLGYAVSAEVGREATKLLNLPRDDSPVTRCVRPLP